MPSERSSSYWTPGGWHARPPPVIRACIIVYSMYYSSAAGNEHEAAAANSPPCAISAPATLAPGARLALDLIAPQADPLTRFARRRGVDGFGAAEMLPVRQADPLAHFALRRSMGAFSGAAEGQRGVGAAERPTGTVPVARLRRRLRPADRAVRRQVDATLAALVPWRASLQPPRTDRRAPDYTPLLAFHQLVGDLDVAVESLQRLRTALSSSSEVVVRQVLGVASGRLPPAWHQGGWPLPRAGSPSGGGGDGGRGLALGGGGGGRHRQRRLRRRGGVGKTKGLRRCRPGPTSDSYLGGVSAGLAECR